MAFSSKIITWLIKEAPLSSDQQALINDGIALLRQFEEKKLNLFSDYSFLVAPFAKAYEGFLKDLFLGLGLITKEDYFSDHFRVGKVLNPHLKKKSFSVYSSLERKGKEGERLASLLWKAWKKGRNLIFHYFPHNLNKLSFEEAKERIGLISEAIREAVLFLDKERLIKDNSGNEG